jgi:BirA family transcriptional regulator, biotin operon repressor / biotin---[acetyl-CoA-carboxylase] ligase
MTLDTVRLLRETFVARVEYHPTVASTNDRAARLAAQGARDLPLLVVADQQTAGRGRGANRWWTGPGSLAFSLLVEAEMVAADAGRSPLVSLAVAVAVTEAVVSRLTADCPDFRAGENGTVPLNRPDVGIRWPNDVLAAGRKLCGILVEVLPDRRHVIGIGLNVNNTAADTPAELRTTIATLRDLTGRTHDRTETLIDLLGRLERVFSALRADAASVAARADALCLQRGRSVTLHWGNREVVGDCRGIAADGALLLKTASGVQPFHSGVL